MFCFSSVVKWSPITAKVYLLFEISLHRLDLRILTLVLPIFVTNELFLNMLKVWLVVSLLRPEIADFCRLEEFLVEVGIIVGRRLCNRFLFFTFSNIVKSVYFVCLRTDNGSGLFLALNGTGAAVLI